MGFGDNISIDLNKINTWRFISILLVVVVIFSMRECNINEVQLGDFHVKMKDYEDKTMAYQITVNEQGETISTQKVMLIARDKTIEEELLKNSNLSEVNTQIKLQSELNKGNFVANYSNTDTSFVFVTDTVTKYIKVGTEFTHNEEWFRVAGNVGGLGIEFDTVLFKNNLTLNIGYKKKKGLKNLFKEKEMVIEGINSNPYLSTVGMQNITFEKPKKKWYETRAFATGIGVVAGILIMK